MEEEKKKQIISAIYLAICNGNFRCAFSVFDDSTAQLVNRTLDQVIKIVEEEEKENQKQLRTRIQQLKYEVL